MAERGADESGQPPASEHDELAAHLGRPELRAVLDELLAPVPELLVTLHAGGQIGYVSPAARRVLGYDPRSLVGQPFLAFLDPAEAAEVFTDVLGDVERGRAVPVRIRHADGGFRQMEAVANVGPVRAGGTVVPLVLRAQNTGPALDGLRARLAFEDLLLRMAGAFLHRPAHEGELAVDELLAELGAFAGVDVVRLCVVEAERAHLECRHRWPAEGASAPGPREIPLEDVAPLLDALAAESLYAPRTDFLPSPVRAAHEVVAGGVVGSLLAVPLGADGGAEGFVAFESRAGGRMWSDDHVKALEAAAAILTQALARSDAEARFGLAFDQAPLGMALHAADGRHLQTNPAYRRLVERDADGLVATSIVDLVAEGLAQAELAEAFRALAAGDSDQFDLECRLARPGGDTVWARLSIAAVRRDGGELRYVVSHVEDITDRHLRERALLSSEERFRTLVENLPSVVVRFDRTLDVVYAGPPQLPVAGVELDALRTDPAVLFAGRTDPERWRRDLTTVFESRAPRAMEWEAGVGGENRWFRARAVPELDDDGLVEHVLVVANDITDLKWTEAALVHQALHDPLTGLANRALLVQNLSRALARRSQLGHTVALLFLDLDRFKLVNDSFGHSLGDQLLVRVAAQLAEELRPSDLVARLGGDEFVVLLDDVADPSDPLRVAERILERLRHPVALGDAEVVNTASIGISVAADDLADAEAMLRDADAAMYRAKSLGRDRYEVFDEVLRTQAVQRLHMEAGLRRALEADGLEVHYQAELDLDSGEVVGFEALVRWNHPSEGRLAAWAFIELAEETGLIVDLGAWVLREACRQAGEWQRRRHGRPLTIRVNLSRRQFAQPDLVEQVEAAVVSAGLEPSSLCLEITETALMEDPVAGLRVLEDLRALGVELAIDDFGTGYSSMAYLKRFPVTVLKIDRSFVDGLGDDPEDTAIATAIIGLARALGLQVVAEGVETRRQLEELRRLGCDHGQGFLFARPVPADEAWQITDPFPLTGS